MNEKTVHTESVAAGNKEVDAARVDRTEAALKLVVGHLQAATRGNEIMSAEQTRIIPPAIGLGVSATAIIALWSMASSAPELAGKVLGFTLGMSLMFLASTLDISSAAFLRRAVRRAVEMQSPEHPALRREPWYRMMRPDSWRAAKAGSPDLLAYHTLRVIALAVYLLSLVIIVAGLVMS